jgi:phosphate transport system protein
MDKKHIVKSYDAEIDLLRSKITEMAVMAKEQLQRASEALLNRDGTLAKDVIRGDSDVNQLQTEVDNLAVQMLAKRQPLALDLRYIVSGLKIAADLERIADYAANIAKNILRLNHAALDTPVRSVIRMTELAGKMLKDVMEAYQNSDDEKAVDVWHRDDEINRIYTELLSQLREYMSQDSENTKAFTALLFTARCCERIGDHITNVAESVYYIVHAEPYHGDAREF